MTHGDINRIADLKGHKILIASTSHATFWPWLKQRFGFTDDMAGAYTFNLQPFLLDKSLAVQGYATSEPFEATQGRSRASSSSCSPRKVTRPTAAPWSPRADFLGEKPACRSRVRESVAAGLARLHVQPGAGERPDQAGQPEDDR